MNPAAQPKNRQKRQQYFAQFDSAFFKAGAYEHYLAEQQEEARTTLVPLLIEHMKPEPHWRFLDIGCAMGGVVLSLRERGFDAIGTEISPYCLEHAPAKEWMLFGDVLELPFEDKSFDAALWMDAFYYLTYEELPIAMREILRVTRTFVFCEGFDKTSRNNSQEYNPDPLRTDVAGRFTADEFTTFFCAQGATCVARDIFPWKDFFDCLLKVTPPSPPRTR